MTYSYEEVMKCYIDDCEEDSVVNVIREELLQSIDSMSVEQSSESYSNQQVSSLLVLMIQ